MAQPKKLLVIEDCQSDVFLIERMLEDHTAGHEVRIVCVPRLLDAFQRIDREAFDCILLDLSLRDIDGVASVAALSAETPHTPIIVYSGTESSKVKQEARLCGAKNYLVKGQESGASLKHAIHSVIAWQEAVCEGRPI